MDDLTMLLESDALTGEVVHTAGGLVTFGVASRPLPGEHVSGDLQVVAPFPGGALLAVIDGLGHGSDAAEAARQAAAVLAKHANAEPVHVVSRCHEAIRGTRGVALLVVSLSVPTRTFSWSGVGNIEGWCCRWDANGGQQRTALLSGAGVVGYQLPVLRPRRADLAPSDLFVLATDGVRPEFIGLAGFAGEPVDTAGAMLRQYGRDTDDALVLVVRYAGTTP
jgi:hypothetical protein